MGPAAVRTAPAGVRNRAGPRTGAGKRVAAAVVAGRRARGPGRAQMAAAVVGSGLGRKRAASVLVSCFCKANLDYKKKKIEKWTGSPIPEKPTPSLGYFQDLFCLRDMTFGVPSLTASFPPPNGHSRGLVMPPVFLPSRWTTSGQAKPGHWEGEEEMVPRISTSTPGFCHSYYGRSPPHPPEIPVIIAQPQP